MKTNKKIKPIVTEMIDTGSSVLLYQTNRSWVFQLDDEKPRQFGVVYEILNMSEATGEPEYKDYPFVVSASITAHKCHTSFNEMSDDCKPDLTSLRYDCYSYMGGIPVDHTLQDATKGGDEPEERTAFQSLADQFTADEAKVVTHVAQFGTYAAQNGPGAEHSYLQFKTEQTARKFVSLLAKRAGVLNMMIGFTLDRPINMMGEDGWSVITKMVRGAK